MPDPHQPAGTPVAVLRTHGLSTEIAVRLGQAFATVERAAASLSHHEAGLCGERGPQPCPWHTTHLSADVVSVTHAINAWFAIGWIERGLLASEPKDGAGTTRP